VKKALILISGIAEHAYGHEQFLASIEGEDFAKGFDLVENYDYQPALDAWTLPGKVSRVYMDPVRLRLNLHKSQKVRKGLEDKVKSLKNGGYEVTLVCHSLGCWVAAMSKVEVENVYFFGSPIGWATPVLRSIVRNQIDKLFFPIPLHVANLFVNYYSINDIVGNIPTAFKRNGEPSKWAFGADRVYEFETYTPHHWPNYMAWVRRNGGLQK